MNEWLRCLQKSLPTLESVSEHQRFLNLISVSVLMLTTLRDQGNAWQLDDELFPLHEARHRYATNRPTTQSPPTIDG